MHRVNRLTILNFPTCVSQNFISMTNTWETANQNEPLPRLHHLLLIRLLSAVLCDWWIRFANICKNYFPNISHVYAIWMILISHWLLLIFYTRQLNSYFATSLVSSPKTIFLCFVSLSTQIISSFSNKDYLLLFFPSTFPLPCLLH